MSRNFGLGKRTKNLTKCTAFFFEKSKDIVRKKGLVSNRLLISASNLVDKTQARTTLLRGSIPGGSVTEENVGDCAVVLPPKINKILRTSPKKSKIPLGKPKGIFYR